LADLLCTIAQVKARLQTSAGGVTFSAADDTLLTELVTELSDWIEGETHRKFAPEVAATYVFDTSAGYVLRVPRGIRTITSMGVNNTAHQPDSGGTYTTVTAPDRILRPKAADLEPGWPPTEVRISRGTLAGTIRSFGTIENGCTITGDFGFATVPPAIEAVAIDATVAAYQSRKNGASGVIGADGNAVVPWSMFFGPGSPQRRTLGRFTYYGVG
jgi:hypothetical protein